MMYRLSGQVKQHPIIAFFVLAYALSWWGWALYAVDLSPMPIAPFGPFLAALVVLAITRGRMGIGGLLRSMIRWRVGLRWYAVALGLPALVVGTAAALNVMLGARAPSAAELASFPSLLPVFFILLLVPGFGGAWEEPGWRGYAVPTLQAHYSALATSLIVGLMWAFWHLPLMATGMMDGLSEIVIIVAVAVVFTWVFNGANGSVLILMLMHATNNLVSGKFFFPMFSGADSVQLSWLLAALWCAVAVAVVLWAGPTHLSRERRKHGEPPGHAPGDSATTKRRAEREVLR